MKKSKHRKDYWKKTPCSSTLNTAPPRQNPENNFVEKDFQIKNHLIPHLNLLFLNSLWQC